MPLSMGGVCILAHERIALVAAVHDLQSTLIRRIEGDPVKTRLPVDPRLPALRSMVAAGLEGPTVKASRSRYGWHGPNGRQARMSQAAERP